MPETDRVLLHGNQGLHEWFISWLVTVFSFGHEVVNIAVMILNKEHQKNVKVISRPQFKLLTFKMATPPISAPESSSSLILPNFSLKVLAIPLPSLKSWLTQWHRLWVWGHVKRSPRISLNWKPENFCISLAVVVAILKNCLGLSEIVICIVMTPQSSSKTTYACFNHSIFHKTGCYK